MFIDALRLGPLETNCWFVGEREGGQIVVIDPADDVEAIIAKVGSSTVAAIVLTHCHFDHLGAVGELVKRTGAPLLVHEDDADYLTSPEGTGGGLFGFDTYVAPEADRTLREGDSVQAAGLLLRVLHTPGHTPGGICLFAEDPEGGAPHVFSGDTLFAGSVGRTDFARGEGFALKRSIAEKLSPLPAETIVHPGHGPDTTIGREASINPFWPRT